VEDGMRRLLVMAVMAASSFASIDSLTLQDALDLVKKNNLEIRIAKFKEQMAKYDTKIAQSYNFGVLDVEFNALRSNDAGNVFGFKLQSREATFGDFGFSDFLGGIGWVLQNSQDFNTFKSYMGNPQLAQQLLATEPKDLNYPQARSHFQTKATYKVPLFTGFKLSMYEKISKAMERMSHLDTKKVANEKIYQTKKPFMTSLW
jgi:hypothetical protein